MLSVYRNLLTIDRHSCQLSDPPLNPCVCQPSGCLFAQQSSADPSVDTLANWDPSLLFLSIRIHPLLLQQFDTGDLPGTIRNCQGQDGIIDILPGVDMTPMAD